MSDNHAKIAWRRFSAFIACMLPFRAAVALASILTLSGCGYVHLGRLPEAAPSDSQLTVAYSNLSTEHKMLQQELVLARKEGDALRNALENRSSDGGAAAAELTARLNETSKELATLRANYAKLQADRSASPSAGGDAELRSQLSATEEKLASSMRNYTQLQEENSRLKTDLDRTRTENVSLSAQVKTATAQYEQTQAALAQLNTELLAQKAARSRAEQQAAATSAQLSAVMAQSSDKPASLSSARAASAGDATVINAPVTITASTATSASPTAELRTNPARLRTAGSSADTAAVSTAPTPAPAARLDVQDRISTHLYIVQAGDTLEKIAKKFYGDTTRWTRIYVQNNSQLSGGRPLKPGMQLEIPDN